MLKNKVISITELRHKTSFFINAVQKEEKIIFVNNKPQAVLIWIDKYEQMKYGLNQTEMNAYNKSLQELTNNEIEDGKIVLQRIKKQKK